jgi:hypothetical protein
MAFFESIPQSPPPDPPRRPRRRPWMQPETVIPGSVPAELLVRAEAVGVALGSLRAYPNGFEFTLHVRLRPEDEESSHGMSDPFDWHASGSPWTTRDRALRLGILYADGRRTATTSRRPILPDGAEAGELVLQQGGSSGSDRRWDGDFWVHPLPADGPVTFVASWLAYGVIETRAQVEGSAIRAAASRAIDLWPDDPDDEPGGGWTSSTITAAERGEPGANSPPSGPV